MATDWPTARAQIATLLQGVDGITKAFTYQPNTLADFPAVVVMGAAKQVVGRIMSTRTKHYGIRLRVVSRMQDLAAADAELDVLTEAIIDMFDDNVKIGIGTENYSIISGPDWEEPAMLDVGGMTHPGVDGVLVIKLQDAKAFGV